MDLGVLGSIYLGVHRASACVQANRLRCRDIGLARQLDAAFASEVPAELGYGFWPSSALTAAAKASTSALVVSHAVIHRTSRAAGFQS